MTYLQGNPDQFQTLNLGHRFLIRTLDVTAASLGLILLAPVFAVISLSIKWSSSGPVFYRAVRVGRDERLFRLYKFRSMYLDADRSGQAITIKRDPRVTPIGRFLRRVKLDELPQLINVLSGDMSLVGPRPEDPRYVALYTPEQRQVLRVRPGMTSRASVYYREEEDLLTGHDWDTVYQEQIMPRKLAADLAYLHRRTFWTDMGLIVETLFAILNGGRRLNSIQELRNRHFLLMDVLVLLLIPTLALAIRLDGFRWLPALIPFTIATLVVTLPIFYGLGLYNRYWRYAGLNDLMTVVLGVSLSTVLLTALSFGLHPVLEPYGLALYRSVPLIAGLLTLLAVGGSRLAARLMYYWDRRHRIIVGGQRVLVVGAGESGTMIVRELRANPRLDMEPVAFVDDDPAKAGSMIQGLKVAGTSREIPELVKQLRIQQIIITLPSAPLGRRQEIAALCGQNGTVVHALPGMYELLGGYKTVNNAPRLEISRLLRREPIVANGNGTSNLIRGTRVLVTGAGGSIGSELCRQVAQLEPADILLLGHGENSIFEIDLELRLSHPQLNTRPVVKDVRNEPQIDQIIREFKPDVIFHAAAHKHVHLMQENVVEAISNNIGGTHCLLRAAERYGIPRFVLISSDKAVNPTSIMGATKRLAEWLVIAAAQRTGRAYMAVRFGNVLDSRGSVLRVFKQQIASGGPLTVTHPDMRRYFMTIPEAVHLVLQAAELGRGGEAFVLDMGQPLRILDIAIDLIKSAGLELERDIQIVYSGAKPGEKLDEELFQDSETYRRTENHQIFVASARNGIDAAAVEQIIAELIGMANCDNGRSQTGALLETLFEVCNHVDNYETRSRSALPEPLARMRSLTPPLALPRQPSNGG